jgi:hypothetical protein
MNLTLYLYSFVKRNSSGDYKWSNAIIAVPNANGTHRHINLLPWKKCLLLKAETLYFIEVNCSLQGRKLKISGVRIWLSHGHISQFSLAT